MRTERIAARPGSSTCHGRTRWFDVLMYYAVVSVLVAFLVGRSERVVRGWIVGSGGPGTDSWPEQVWYRLTEMATFRAEPGPLRRGRTRLHSGATTH